MITTVWDLIKNVLTLFADVLLITNTTSIAQNVNISPVPGISTVKNTITIDIAVPAIVIAIAAIILIL
jgi:hypothetical protein